MESVNERPNMNSRRETTGSSLLQRYLSFLDRRMLNMDHYASTQFLIARRKHETNLPPSDNRTVIDLTSREPREQSDVERVSAPPAAKAGR